LSQRFRLSFGILANNQPMESLMMKPLTSLTQRETSTRTVFVQTVIGLTLVIAIAAFGVFSATHATGQETRTQKAATANVLPALTIWSETREPNLNGVLATGDGAAALPAEEVVGGVSRNAFDR
jgi:hypothetical protein